MAEINEKLRANFPVVSILALIVIVAGGVWQAASLHHQITGEFLAINRAVLALDNKIVGKGPNGWHYPQMDRFCLEAEQLNDGWTCPDPRVVIDRTFVR